DSKSFISIISKQFQEQLKKLIIKKPEHHIIRIYSNSNSSLEIIKNILIHLRNIIISSDIEVIDINIYNLVFDTNWLRKANIKILLLLTGRKGGKSAIIKFDSNSATNRQ